MLIQNTAKLEHPKLRVFLYGDSGSGKTTSAATWPKPLFLTPANEGSEVTLLGRDFDFIRLGLDDHLRPVPVRAHISNVFAELEKRLRTALKATTDEEADALFPWQTIVFESLTHYCDLVVEDVSNGGNAKMDQLAWGRVSTHLRTVYNRLNGLDSHVVLTSLAKTVVGETKVVTGGPAIIGAMAQKLPSACDIIGYTKMSPSAGKKPPVYRTHFQQHGAYVARARFRGFPAKLDDFKFADVEQFLVQSER